MKLREEVQWFAERMEGRLAKFDQTCGEDGWKNDDYDFFLGRIDETKHDLAIAIKQGDGNLAIKEATDLANFAMMVADIVREEPFE